MKLFRLILVSFLAFCSFGLYLSNRIMYIKRKEDNFIYKRELNAGRIDCDEFNALPKREMFIPSKFSYHLHALIIEPHQTNYYVIFCHGVTENKINSMKYMNLFLKRGFNALIYDQRRHGQSGGNTTSYGYYEKYDLQSVVEWLRQDRGPELQLGIHGESMGAATMLLYAGEIEDYADFYIADCSFSDLREQLGYRMKTETHLPPMFLLPIADLFIKFRDNYWLREVSPLSAISAIKKPILFIHSTKDDFILPSMTRTLFHHKLGPKKIFYAPLGQHAQSLNENKQQYEQVLDEFLQEYFLR